MGVQPVHLTPPQAPEQVPRQSAPVVIDMAAREIPDVGPISAVRSPVAQEHPSVSSKHACDNLYWGVSLPMQPIVTEPPIRSENARLADTSDMSTYRGLCTASIRPR
jgi:hypothetical protein